mmetsp:Transcript_25640/g.28726  ORF Transcript_25640/g.28726 Transcript_25640/m.28726 type:complete len:215 (-) Transcript_25640:140-784(-)
MGGCCCSCMGDDDDGAVTTKESELVKQDTAQKSINIRMSSPGIKVEGEGDLCATGSGLALIGTALEQDAAYWEFHISLPVGKQVDTILFGVSTKKGRKFYEEVKYDEQSGEEGIPSEANGTDWMRCVEGIQNDDVIGIAMQQSDLPMVQFFHNGEALYDIVVNRFRGIVYPSVCLPASSVEKDLKVTAIVAENKFQQMSPAAKFGPIIVARSIV